MRVLARWCVSWRWLIIAGVSLVLLALIAVPYAVSWNNTLRSNGNWVSGKDSRPFRLRPRGAREFISERQTLAGGHLDLGTWQGFHEVLFGRKLAPKSVSFRFSLSPDSHLSFLFDRTDTTFQGIRFSRNKDLPNVRFSADISGEFTSKADLPIRKSFTDGWNECRVDFRADGLDLSLNGERFTVSRAAALMPTQVGFRGGYASVLVDDVDILDVNGRRFTDSFDKPGYTLAIGPLILFSLLFVEVLLLVGFRLFFRGWRRSLEYITAVNLSMFCAIVTLFFFTQMVLAKRYPVKDKNLSEEERRFLEELVVLRRAELDLAYAKSPAPGVERIMFFGSSQTWGEGASSYEDTFVRRIERTLNERAGPHKRYECINAGIQGARAVHMEFVYQNEFVQYHPELTVISLSCNDSDDRTPENLFLARLRRMVQINKDAGIRTLLVLEPASPEVLPEGFRTYPLVRQIAQEEGVPIIDPNPHLKAHEQDGFLFWDFVHLTSYGHKLVAEVLASYLQQEASP